MDVSPAIIHFNAAFKELFRNKLQAGVEPATIFREAGIDPDMLGKTRVDGFKGMLKVEVKKGKGFRDLTTSNEYYARNMTAEQRISYLEQQIEYKDQEIEFLKNCVFDPGRQGLMNIPASAKYAIIREMTMRDNNRLNLSRLCETACVSRSGYTPQFFANFSA
ncbi:MAG: hypothetical protein IKF06_04175 [Lachnospiraceae bacterium]|nr:hypothetical protein [Lachnospiraceae bacterium]